MDSLVNSEGLARLLRHELCRLSIHDQRLATQRLKERFGAYDIHGTAIDREVQAFFKARIH